MLTYPVGLLNPKTDIISELVLEYLFSGNANDTSGNNINGTVLGATLTTDRKSASNSAYQFQIGDDIHANYNSLLDFGLTESPFSISVWVFMDNTSKFRILGQNNIYSYILYTSAANQLIIQLLSSNSIYIGRIASTTFIGSTWKHIVITYNGNQSVSGINMFLDAAPYTSGVLNAGSYTGMRSFASNNFLVGDITGSLKETQGKIDDLRIYNKVLTGSEITALYNE